MKINGCLTTNTVLLSIKLIMKISKLFRINCGKGQDIFRQSIAREYGIFIKAGERAWVGFDPGSFHIVRQCRALRGLWKVRRYSNCGSVLKAVG